MENIAINLLYVSIGIILFLILIITYLVYTIRRFEKSKRKLESKIENFEQNTRMIRLENLESKLNPHLFKNILNSIQSHAFQTYHALDNLANVLDYILYESRNKWVTPKEEIDFALNLIEINKIKLSPLFDLRVKLKIDETDAFYGQNLIAPLVSVDLIENAFKHADFHNTDTFISIIFEFKNNTFTLIVSNKVSTHNNIQKSYGGIGSKTYEERLKILYKDNFTLERQQIGNKYIAQLKINLRGYKDKMLTD